MLQIFQSLAEYYLHEDHNREHTGQWSVVNLVYDLHGALKVRSHGAASATAFLLQLYESVHTVWQITIKTIKLLLLQLQE